jgi:hypothetical protein
MTGPSIVARTTASQGSDSRPPIGSVCQHHYHQQCPTKAVTIQWGDEVPQFNFGFRLHPIGVIAQRGNNTGADELMLMLQIGDRVFGPLKGLYRPTHLAHRICLD